MRKKSRVGLKTSCLHPKENARFEKNIFKDGSEHVRQTCGLCGYHKWVSRAGWDLSVLPTAETKAQFNRSQLTLPIDLQDAENHLLAICSVRTPQ